MCPDNKGKLTHRAAKVSQQVRGLWLGTSSRPPLMLMACSPVIFPQFSHACDGPGLSMLCFMRRDILEYFSIYGTALSMWVSLMGEWLSLPVGGGGSQSPTPARAQSISEILSLLSALQSQRLNLLKEACTFLSCLQSCFSRPSAVPVISTCDTEKSKGTQRREKMCPHTQSCRDHHALSSGTSSPRASSRLKGIFAFRGHHQPWV